ncbi:hypothetical protein OSCI_800013 [Kamptonema sp. PCC 6506]|nr:hypothetical protein OSCI_800013 [Kamptonema sp. PCC 6506]
MREAIAAANNTTGTDAIALANTLDITDSVSINAAQGQLI